MANVKKVKVEGGIGKQTGKPMVSIRDLNGNLTVLTSDEARDLARTLVECAAAIDVDAVFVRYMEDLGTDPRAANELLKDLRKRGGKFRTKEVGNANEA